MKDECCLCGRVLPYGYLRRCQRCGRLYCIDCMIADVSTNDFTRMFCLNCARRSVSPKSGSKYDALSRHLKFRSAFTDTVRLSFSQIDGIISDNLPMSAYRTESWWNNTPTNVHAKGWLDAGWTVQEANLKDGYIIFKKSKVVKAKSFRKRTSHNEIKPFTPVRVRMPKSNRPSKTKVSKLFARLKNLERQRASTPVYPGSFKPKPKHERRLFKSEKKPQ
ncbi:hypothetical protein HXY33_00565 [Candidatus Bathyarchaeota archaeon]|nr:hypothetical protein [Candidatus Bathyarchaeota archaeon]